MVALLIWSLEMKKSWLSEKDTELGFEPTDFCLCPGLNSVPPKPMSTWNLRLGPYLEIEALQM